VGFFPSRITKIQLAFDQPIANELNAPTHQANSGPEPATIFHERLRHPIIGLIRALPAADG